MTTTLPRYEPDPVCVGCSHEFGWHALVDGVTKCARPECRCPRYRDVVPVVQPGLFA